MSVLEEKAGNVINDLKGSSEGSHEVFFDPATLLAVISIISQAIKLYQSCNKTPSAAQVSMKSPGFLERRRLRKIVRQHLNENHSDETVSSVMNGVLKQGQTVSVEEVEKMFAEAV